MSFNEQHQNQIAARSAFPSKQQLREADALAFAQRRGAVVNPASIPGVTSGAALLQERREFDEANAIRHAQYQADLKAQQRKAKAPSCKELAQDVKDNALVHAPFDRDWFNETNLKYVLTQMLGKIHRLEIQVKSLEEINEAQADLVIKLTKKFKSDAKAEIRNFDSAGS